MFSPETRFRRANDYGRAKTSLSSSARRLHSHSRPLGQFLVSPEGQFRMSLDTVRAELGYPSYAIMHHTLQPWICSWSRPSASTCFTSWSLFGWPARACVDRCDCAADGGNCRGGTRAPGSGRIANGHGRNSRPTGSGIFITCVRRQKLVRYGSPNSTGLNAQDVNLIGRLG